MRNILLIIYLSLTPIFVATAATDIDSMECVLAKMPSGDRLVKLDELASDKGQGLDYKYYADLIPQFHLREMPLFGGIHYCRLSFWDRSY